MLNTEAQSRIQAILDDRASRNAERGLQVAAYKDGELVVDAWAGVADPPTGRSVDGDTLFTIFSSTKAVAATAVHILADRGKIDYETSVAAYWPEFGAHGKDSITVRNLLAHMTGTPQLPEGTTPDDLADWDLMCRRIADLVPMWEPATVPGYSSFAWGWMVGELVRRVEGRPIAGFLREEICRPLEIEGLFMGVPASAETRVALLEDGGWVESLNSSPQDAPRRKVLPPALGTPEVFNMPSVRRASIPAIGGIANARSLARFYSALAPAVPDEGPRLLSDDALREATRLVTDAEDRVLGAPARKSMGYVLGGPNVASGGRITSFGHGGIGGCMGFGDPDHRFAFSLTKNRLTVAAPEDNLSLAVAREIRDALGIPES
jgi:CubicO group peptidase (beta-lactamase class C family)